MSLKEKTEAKKEEFQASASKETQEVMARSVKTLIESGATDRALGEGDTAPDFALTNAEGAVVRLEDFLARGPVVLGFYRGRW